MTLRKTSALFVLALMSVTMVPHAQAQEVDVPRALVWPQFAIGPLGDGSAFEVELLITNTSSTRPYAGQLLAADQAFTPIDGIEVASSETRFVQGGQHVTLASTGDIRPTFANLGSFTLGPRETIKLRFFASALISSVIIGFLILNCLSGSNDQVVASASYRRISSGLVINVVPLLPVIAALTFTTNFCLLAGVNTGLAIVSIVAPALVQIIAYSSGTAAGTQDAGSFPQQEVYTGTVEVYGQVAKFPDELISNLPDEVSGGMLEIRSEFPIWVTALDVVGPPKANDLEIGAKIVKSSGPVQ